MSPNSKGSGKTIAIVVIAIIIALGLIYYFLGKKGGNNGLNVAVTPESQKTFGGEVLGNVSGSADVAGKISPEVNPFKAIETNPYQSAYKNPFSN